MSGTINTERIPTPELRREEVLEAVGFLDSGLGGYPYLEQALEDRPREHFVYAADNRGFPYGVKKEREIQETVLRAVEALKNRVRLKALVLACNTASVVALEKVRETVDFPVVGVVPAVKPAARLSRSGHIGLLATRRTLEGAYLKELLQRHAPGCRIDFLDGTDLVNFIENEYFKGDRHSRLRYVKEQIQKFPPGMDTLVLGCTHFVYLKDLFRAELPDIRLLDSRQGVVNRLSAVLTQKEEEEEEKKKEREELVPSSSLRSETSLPSPGPSRSFFLTAPPASPLIYRSFCRTNSLDYAGIL